MEFSFEYYGWLQAIDEKPAIIVFSVGFGIPLFMAIFFGWLSSVLKLPLLRAIKDAVMYTGIVAFLITWLLGFIISMIMLFSGLSGIRMLLIICALFLSALCFAFFNKASLKKWSDRINAKVAADSAKPIGKRRKNKPAQ